MMNAKPFNENNMYTDDGNGCIKVSHNHGFFSCCSVILNSLVDYFNKNKNLPIILDTSDCFSLYKKWVNNLCSNNDITYHFFKNYNLQHITINHTNDIYFNHCQQFYNYRDINFKDLQPFINKFFQPSDDIFEIIDDIETKYCLYDYSNICTIFYRGNDKSIEIMLGDYNGYVERAKTILQSNPKTIFIVQSDELEFIDLFKKTFPKKNLIIFNDEIRYIPRVNTSVDLIDLKSNYNFSKNFLAITNIMSKSKYIICNTGNCSLWILLYRGHTNNLYQERENIWL